MTIDRSMSWRRSAWIALAAALGLAASAHAQTPACAPPASAQLPVVNTGLPVVQIWTTNAAPILDRENYVAGCMRITDGTVQRYGQGLYHSTLKIRGRGNTSWEMPKKGYRLKLDAASAVLDMPAHKDWVLLANYADKTLMRNQIGFELSRRVGMAWTPRMRYAEVYLNDAFLGNYQLGEKIEVAPNRVAITPMAKTDIAPPALTGGYLIETEYFDRLAATDRFFTTDVGASNINFALQSPSADAVTAEQMAYIASYTQAIENAIFAGDNNAQTGYPSLIDVESFISFYLVSELLKNVDSAFRSSVYLHKERDAKMKMGPLWDFDLSAGNLDFYPDAMPAKGWYLNDNSRWFEALLRDPVFKARLKVRWTAFRRSIGDLNAYIDNQARVLDASQKQNFARWPILGTYVWPNQYVAPTYKGEVTWLKNWLTTRIKWIDQNIGK